MPFWSKRDPNSDSDRIELAALSFSELAGGVLRPRLLAGAVATAEYELAVARDDLRVLGLRFPKDSCR